MSKWHEIKDQDDVSLSDDNKMIQVCFDSDRDGNIWVEIPLEFIRKLVDTTDNPTNNESPEVKSKPQIKGEELEEECIEALNKIDDKTINFFPVTFNPMHGFTCMCKEPMWKEYVSRYKCLGCGQTVHK